MGYPSGPYGTSEGSIIENLSFVAPDDTPLALGDIYADGNNALLLVATAAGWCTACIEEQPALQDLANTYGSEGLYVLVSIFEDANFIPATAALAAAWKSQYALDVTVVADPPFVLDAYYDSSLTPMNMLVDVSAMKILRTSTGWDRGAIEAIIEARL